MLKRILTVIAAIVATVVLAAILLARTISNGAEAMSVQNGDWITSVSAGAADADPLLKTTVAIGALLASTRENSMYYRLSTVDGEPLRLNCRYRIEGQDYDANWWSITAYGWDNYLIPNAEKRYSFNNENLIRRSDGSWVITVAASEQPGNWLPVGPSGAPPWRRLLRDYDFDLLMRLYTPGEAYLNTPQTAPMPTVTLEDCE